MRVKRLEVQGFKSFKDKTVIHFDHSITGIVGPNGCGKSNVVDAFFWVMGEQSNKHMRAGGSADLIFNGSSKYAPLGFAEATMVLETDAPDTSDAPAGATVKDLPLHLRSKEIAVTRRVYRSGEGEYFMNGVPARLKDIQELFMDTGIGAKGYSIIAQGEIQKIVNAKPEDRRLLIEEAAGIAKYKARKKESLRKMEAAQANLSRLNDVIQEIERSLNSLERQAQKASQYKKLREELLDKEMTWGRRKNKVLSQKLEELKTKREALEQELVGLRAELSTTENSIETERNEQLDLSKSMEALQASIQEKSSELTRAQSALDLSRRRQSDLTTQLETLEAEQSDLSLAIETEKEKISGLESENAGASEEFEAASTRVSEKEEEVRELRAETETARRSVDQAKRDLMNSIAQSSDLQSKAAALDSRAKSAAAQIERLNQQVSQLAEKVTATRAEFEKAEALAKEAAEKKASLSAQSKEMAEAVQAQDSELRNARRAMDDENRELTKLRSKLQSLEELAAAYEGFGDGPKSVLDWAKAKGRDAGLKALADGLTVTTGYEAVLEGWLEGKLENLASDDVDFALAALRELNAGNSGRASIYVSSFAVKPEVSYEKISEKLTKWGFTPMGELASFVKVNEKLAGTGAEAAHSVLTGVAVVETMDPIEAIVAEGGMEQLHGWALVAKDGTALDRDGSLRGGALTSDNSASLLGRKRAIEELQVQVATLEEKFAATEARVNQMTESLELARAALAQTKSEWQSAEIEAATTERDVHQMSRTMRDVQSQAELAQYELTEMTTESEEALVNKVETEAKMEEVIRLRSELEEKIAAQEGALTEREESLRTEEDALSVLKIQEASLKERANSIRRELESGQNLIRDRERRLADVKRALDRATNENAEHSGGDSEFLATIEELTATLAVQREELSGVRERLGIVSSKVGGALDRIKELHSTGDTKSQTVNQYSLDIERITADLSHLIQNLEEKYGPGCLELPVTSPIQEEMDAPVVTHEMTAEEEKLLGEEVERLRDRIRRLGDVNPTAIEEFEEKKKRFDYLAAEKSDLEKSIEDLMEAIEHINKTSEDRFRRAFEAIADRFERLFPIIFGGGQAKLSLVYPEGSTDILEAGVDILAQPPGKKIVNIGLLSGGEKALTAVSLIFAIFMVKPSPFCVLDEVDAPLDDANIGKFNALLREMSAKSQFIIITHNKKTMELNDTLYGVTMEEPGVSKMVSIEMH